MISIAIGVRNRNQQLKNCLFSLKHQTFQSSDYEVFVINYGGNSDTKTLVNSFNSKNFKYIYVDVGGIFNESRAKNIGIRKSTGSHVISTNADIIFDLNFLTNFNKEIQKNKDFLYQIVRNDLYPHVDVTGIYNRLNETSLFTKDNYFIGPKSGEGDFQATSKKYWEEVRGYDERMTGWGYLDIDLSYRLNKIGIKQIWLDNEKYKIYHQYHQEKEVSKLNINSLLSEFSNDTKPNDEKWGLPQRLPRHEIVYKSKDLSANIKKILRNKLDWMIVIDEAKKQDYTRVIKSIIDYKISDDYTFIPNGIQSVMPTLINKIFPKNHKGIYLFSNRLLTLIIKSSNSNINLSNLITKSEELCLN